MCFKKKYKNTDNQHSVTQQKTCIHLKSAFAQKLLKSQRQDTNSAVKLVHRSMTITEAHKECALFLPGHTLGFSKYSRSSSVHALWFSNFTGLYEPLNPQDEGSSDFIWDQGQVEEEWSECKGGAGESEEQGRGWSRFTQVIWRLM